MEHDPQAYETARRRVIDRLVLRGAFVFSLLFYLLVMALMWLQPARRPDDTIPILFATLILGVPVLILGLAAFQPFAGWIDRAARREMERAAVYDKPKRKRLELREDGEVVEVDETLLTDDPMRQEQ